MIDKRIRVLQAVDDHGTVTAAAEALHYTPSAVSHQIRRLAADMGVELVAHSGRKVRLTAAARTLLRRAEVLFAEAERTYADVLAASGSPGGSFTVCGFSTAAGRILPPAVAGLRDENPDLTVRVIEAEPARCFELLSAEEADFALVTATSRTPPSSDGRFDQRPLLDDPLDLVVPEGHRLAAKDAVTLQDAADEDWIVGLPGTAYHHLVLAACMSAGFSPNIAHYADEWETGSALVSYGFGIILVPRLALINAAWPVTRVRLRGEPAPSRRIIAATRSGAADNPLTTAITAAIPGTVAGAGIRPPREAG